MSDLPVFTPFDQFPITGRGVLYIGPHPEGVDALKPGDKVTINGVERLILGIEDPRINPPGVCGLLVDGIEGDQP